MLNISKKSFTLPEILIALTVIGVIASITIITVMQQTYGREIISKVQKSYNVIANAYEQALSAEDIYEWDSLSAQEFTDRITKNMLLEKNCGLVSNLEKGNMCFPNCPKIYKANGGNLDVCKSSDVSKFISSAGFAYAIQVEDQSCATDVAVGKGDAPDNLHQVCGTVLIDIDTSSKSKNKNFYGRDLFLFYITRIGLVPVGSDVDTKYPQKAGECKLKVTKDEFGCSSMMIYGKGKLEQK